MWFHSCVITLTDVSYSFFSVTLFRQLFNNDTTAIFIVALMGIYQQARGQVLGFGEDKIHFRGEIFLFSL